jgi:hypothetical protein
VAANPQLTTRKRGARTLAIALALLVIALLLLAGFEPGRRRYPLVIRLAVCALAGLARAPARAAPRDRRPGTGALAAPLRLIAIAVVVGGVALGLVGAWAIHTVASEPRRVDGHHHDWD